MRYRPFANSGMAVSTVSLRIDETRTREARGLVLAGLEAGINAFEIAGTSPALLSGVGEALGSINRRLAFVAWRMEAREALGLDMETLAARVTRVLEGASLGHLDLLVIADPEGSPPMDALLRLKDLQDTRLVRMLGVAGDSEHVDAYIATGAFEALETTYNLASGWAIRNRLKAAAARDMAVIGSDPCPKALRDAKPQPLGKRSLFKPKPHPLKGIGGYHFLHATPGWAAEDICLAYALTEPAITTVQVEADGAARIQRMSDIPERDLPTGVAAQIEMARFSATA